MMRQYIPTFFEDLEEVCSSLNCAQKTPVHTSSYGVSVSEDPSNFYLEVPVPGIKPEEIEVLMKKESRTLSIKAESKGQQKENVKYHAQAMRRFSYEIPLSNHINMESKLDAICKDGILTLSLPKCTTQQPCKIAVRPA
jgi:HSP20 family protein